MRIYHTNNATVVNFCGTSDGFHDRHNVYMLYWISDADTYISYSCIETTASPMGHKDRSKYRVTCTDSK